MLTAFFLTDKFKGNIKSRSDYYAVPSKDGNYVENVSDPRPRVRWITGADETAQSRSLALFSTDENNRYIEVSSTPTGTITTLTIPYGLYSADQLASEITAQFSASGTYAMWTCNYQDYGKFSFFDATSSGTIYLRFKTGTHGSSGTNKSLANELGFDDSVDASGANTFYSDFPRFDTTTVIAFDKGPILSTDLYAWLCDIDTSGGVDDAIDGSSVKIYGHSSYLGTVPQSWISGATTSLTFSAATQYDENTIRLAHNGGSASGSRYWLWVWRHQDEVRRHKVGLCKAFNRTWSGTRTVTTLAGHGMQQPQRGLGINNYYPVTQLRRWNVPLTFDSWGATDYQTVVQGVVRHGKADGLLWALRWDDIAAGTVNAKEEAEKGFLVWGALQEYSLDTFVGEGADYMSGSLRIEQIR